MSGERRTHREPVQVYLEHWLCECGGEMRKNGNISLLIDPPVFPHACNACGRVILDTDVWPKITYSPLDPTPADTEAA